MPILEVTQLRLKGMAPNDPLLLKNLSMVRVLLQTQSRFYSCVEDPALIYIFGLWPSLEAHQEFLASPRAAEVLGPQEDMLEFRWTVHMELDAMVALPLGAPVLVFTRRTVKEDCVDAYNQALAKERQNTMESTRYNVANGWRVDAAPGVHEALLFTGSPNTQAHVASTAQLECGDLSATSDLYEQTLVHHAWNLEKET